MTGFPFVSHLRGENGRGESIMEWWIGFDANGKLFFSRMMKFGLSGDISNLESFRHDRNGTHFAWTETVESKGDPEVTSGPFDISSSLLNPRDYPKLRLRISNSRNRACWSWPELYGFLMDKNCHPHSIGQPHLPQNYCQPFPNLIIREMSPPRIYWLDI